MDTTNSPWHCLANRLAPEVIRALETIFARTMPLPAPETVTTVIRLFLGLRCSPWVDAIALSAGVCVAVGFPVPNVVAAVRCVDGTFWAGVRDSANIDEWHAADTVRVYLEDGGSGPTGSRRAQFLGSYWLLAHQLCRWRRGLSADLQRSYQLIDSFVAIDLTDIANSD